MVTAVMSLVLNLQIAPPYPDRAAFLHTLAALKDGTPQAEVIRAIGKPDRVTVTTEYQGSRAVPLQTWFYGTDGPNGAATLARFAIYDGKLAYHPVNDTPPPTSVISEGELRKGMHIVLDQMPPYYTNQTSQLTPWIVNTTNALLPFGEAKCKAIIGECARILEGYAELDPCPYFLAYALFDPPVDKGRFDTFGPVWNAPTPKNPLDHPRWPLDIIHNVPIVRGQPMGGFGGFAPSFNFQFKSIRDRIHLRKSPLSMPKK